MASWWKKKIPLMGVVLFRGELAPKPEEFNYLQKYGIKITTEPKNAGVAWLLELDHPEWGKAELMSVQDAPVPPRELFEYSFIPKADKEAAVSARSLVMLRIDSKYEHVLRDRKLMLRFARAVMGDDGVAVLDDLSSRVWTREQLDDELSHNADLDVEGIINIHAISNESGNIYWVHTHGLSEIGAFDFDIFDPSEETMSNVFDLCRAVAFHVLEGNINASTPDFPLVYPKGNVRLVEMNTFMTNTDPQRKAALASDIDDYHKKNHSVLCEPEGSFLGRMFGGKALQPVRFLTKDLPENPVFSFSTSASNLMAERARNTYPLLKALCQEFAELELPCLVKLGFRTDNGGEDDKEHIWMEVHELLDDSIDATCANQPYNVSGLKEGDRGRHPVDLMSDWTIFTPAGMINPRSTAAARILRANPELIQKMKEHMREEGE